MNYILFVFKVYESIIKETFYFHEFKTEPTKSNVYSY